MNTNRHINITNPIKCSGCSACASICPNDCISMKPDELGCLYPNVDTYACIECGACKNVCPFLNQSDSLEPRVCFAAVNNDEDTRLRSSSGGVFMALAQHTLNQKGVVFGAAFDKFLNVHHIEADCIEGIEPMLGSKYLQSNPEDTFVRARDYLKSGREVLYTGTPCQIAGLKHFLGKDYPNLLAVEVVCHGVPAPGVWQSYLNGFNHECKDEIEEQNSIRRGKNTRITSVSFRDKRKGWSKYGISLIFSPLDKREASAESDIYQLHKDNAYIKAFLRNWSLRSSCFDCKAKGGHSRADITIGDFWGIDRYPNLPNDNKGTSCVVIRSKHGEDIFEHIKNLTLTECNYEIIRIGNPCIEKSVKSTSVEKRFKHLILRQGFGKAFYKMEHPSISHRCIRRVKSKFGI